MVTQNGKFIQSDTVWMIEKKKGRFSQEAADFPFGIRQPSSRAIHAITFLFASRKSQKRFAFSKRERDITAQSIVNRYSNLTVCCFRVKKTYNEPTGASVRK